uniref:Uncharacterized protein n=1 Tax=Archaeoglobus fulgidus TaxID=2234 RepID=A0A7C3RLE6_ARCFL
MRLSEAPWFKGLYAKIYDVLNAENLLPPAEEIHVLQELPEDIRVGSNVMGLCWRERKALWFREQPPAPVIFAHELLHLIEKDAELEEVYACNLSMLAVILAMKEIVPSVSIVRLFSLREEQVLEAVRRAYNYRFESLEEYFTFMGAIPHIYEFEFDKEKGFRLKKNKLYAERDIVITIISEIISATEYDNFALKTLLILLSFLENEGGLWC